MKTTMRNILISVFGCGAVLGMLGAQLPESAEKADPWKSLRPLIEEPKGRNARGRGLYQLRQGRQETYVAAVPHRRLRKSIRIGEHIRGPPHDRIYQHRDRKYRAGLAGAGKLPNSK